VSGGRSRSRTPHLEAGGVSSRRPGPRCPSGRPRRRSRSRGRHPLRRAISTPCARCTPDSSAPPGHWRQSNAPPPAPHPPGPATGSSVVQVVAAGDDQDDGHDQAGEGRAESRTGQGPAAPVSQQHTGRADHHDWHGKPVPDHVQKVGALADLLQLVRVRVGVRAPRHRPGVTRTRSSARLRAFSQRTASRFCFCWCSYCFAPFALALRTRSFVLRPSPCLRPSATALSGSARSAT